MTPVTKEDIDWDQIDDLFLDMDGTLLDLHYDHYFWMEHLPLRLSEIKKIQLEQIRAEMHGRYEAMRGTLDWYCLDFWQKELDVDLMSIKREVIAKIQFRPSTEAFLKSLKGIGKRVSLISNSHRLGIDLKFDHLKLHGYFDLIRSSHDYGYPKEQQGFWRHLSQDIGFDIHRTVFIDDNIDVLKSAQAYGIKYLLSIKQPDLFRAPVPYQGFKQVDDFSEILGNI